jgi:hypothetical protein
MSFSSIGVFFIFDITYDCNIKKDRWLDHQPFVLTIKNFYTSAATEATRSSVSLTTVMSLPRFKSFT